MMAILLSLMLIILCLKVIRVKIWAMMERYGQRQGY